MEARRIDGYAMICEEHRCRSRSSRSLPERRRDAASCENRFAKVNNFGQAADPSGRWRFVRVGAAIRNHAGRARARRGVVSRRARRRARAQRSSRNEGEGCDALGAPAPWPRSSVDRCSRGIVSTPRLGSAPPSPRRCSAMSTDAEVMAAVNERLRTLSNLVGATLPSRPESLARKLERLERLTAAVRRVVVDRGARERPSGDHRGTDAERRPRSPSTSFRASPERPDPESARSASPSAARAREKAEPERGDAEATSPASERKRKPRRRTPRVEPRSSLR